MFRKKLLIVLGTMLVFSLVSGWLIAAFGRKSLASRPDGADMVVVTSFYPVYVLVENLCENVDGVSVRNLTENHTGCLHDYQLTTEDMLLLETADALVINGGDTELFVEEIAKELPDLAMIDASAELTFLDGVRHDHENTADGGSEQESFEEGAVNGHVWADMERYKQQVQTVAHALAMLDAGREQQYLENASRYLDQIDALWQEYQDEIAELSGLEVVIFHDSFSYLCDFCGIKVLHSVSLDADTALSAGEIAQIEDEICEHGVTILFAEEATGAIARQIAQGTGCQVVYLDPLTSGDARPEAYLTAMRENFEKMIELKQ